MSILDSNKNIPIPWQDCLISWGFVVENPVFDGFVMSRSRWVLFRSDLELMIVVEQFDLTIKAAVYSKEPINPPQLITTDPQSLLNFIMPYITDIS